MNELIVLLDGHEAGVARSERGKFLFSYTESWRASRERHPLSLSMPLTAKDHSHSAVEPFMWGLLPDNEQVLRSWGQKFQVSPRNAFELLSHVGEDCAGAVQFVRPEKLEASLVEEHPEPDWLTEAELAERLRLVRSDASAGRLPNDRGQFSLAGAQPKTALFHDGKRWGTTSGRTPTTHIIKPTTSEFHGHAENEHLCLRLAAALGLITTKSWVKYFEDVPAIVVERYDRLIFSEAARNRKAHAEHLLSRAAEIRVSSHPESTGDAQLLEDEAEEDFNLADQLLEASTTEYAGRLHQEDLCQALSVHPAIKYQNQGGPGAGQIIETIRTNVSSPERLGVSSKYTSAANDDVETFIDALIFNWLIGGTDAHAKNYSLLIGRGGMVRLAPLYDIASILAYPNIDPRKAKMAMKIGDRYDLMEISISDWRKLAASIRINGDGMIERIRGMAHELPDRLTDEVKMMRESGLSHPVIGKLADSLPERAQRVAKM